jgi:NADH:ubiquinone reductase (H+-translocating)
VSRPAARAPASDGGPSVLVLGGGLAGVAAAQRLGHEQLPVTLVDRNDYHQFQPLLYQVATSQLPAQDIARPHHQIFAELPSVEVVTARAVRLDLAARQVQLADGRTYTGTHLVVAAGARPNFFGIPGAAEHSFPLYSVADAERLRLHLQKLLDAARDGGATGREPSLDVVVVGGGPTGVETTGALAELSAALRSHGLPGGEITIIDRGTSLLGQFSEKAQRYAHEKLTRAGAVVRVGVGVAKVTPDAVELDDGTRLETKTVVWGGGESGAEIAGGVDATLGHGGRLDVQPDLQVAGYPGVYAVGDVANIPARAANDLRALPQLGSVAQQSGRWAAENILRELEDKPGLPFKYKDKGIMAMIGRNAAVAEVGAHRHQVDGPLAFAAWLGVHAMLLSGVHAKTDAFVQWSWDYFDRDHAATLEVASAPHPIGWGDQGEGGPHIVLDRDQDQSTSAAPTANN